MASTSVRTAHPRLRRVVDGGAIMGPQVSLTGGLRVGPPLPLFPFPFPREMPFCFSDPTHEDQFAIRSPQASSKVRTYQDLHSIHFSLYYFIHYR